MKIQLSFSTEPVIDAKSEVELHKGIRLLTVVQFRTIETWSDPQIAIVDTGAPISLVPPKIWTKCSINTLGETELRGVIPKKECIMSVKVAKICLRLLDPEYVTEEIETKAYLAHTDNIPLVVGFEKLLSEFNVFFSYCSQNAFIEEVI